MDVEQARRREEQARRLAKKASEATLAASVEQGSWSEAAHQAGEDEWSMIFRLLEAAAARREAEGRDG